MPGKPVRFILVAGAGNAGFRSVSVLLGPQCGHPAPMRLFPPLTCFLISVPPKLKLLRGPASILSTL